MTSIYCLRVITTYACNLACSFCHREGIYSESRDEIGLKQFSNIMIGFKKFNLQKIKFVGGEPLLSQSILEYVRVAHNVGLPDIGITTNGTNTKGIIKIAKECSFINFTVSVPDLNPSNYRKLTGSDTLSNTIRSLEALRQIDAKITVNYIIDTQDRVNISLLFNIQELWKYTNRIKLVVLCKSPYSSKYENQEYIIESLKKILIENGYSYARDNVNHIEYTDRKNRSLLITVPYCPVLCRTLQRIYPTLRLTPDNYLKPCFLQNTDNIKIPSDVPGIEIAIREALVSTLKCRLQDHSND